MSEGRWGSSPVGLLLEGFREGANTVDLPPTCPITLAAAFVIPALSLHIIGVTTTGPTLLRRYMQRSAAAALRHCVDLSPRRRCTKYSVTHTMHTTHHIGSHRTGDAVLGSDLPAPLHNLLRRACRHGGRPGLVSRMTPILSAKKRLAR